LASFIYSGSGIMRNKTLFWDVDTQFDFMEPQGALYVPGAQDIIGKVSEVRRFALAHGFSILSDVDWHRLDDPEISQQPDLKTTFPPHCLADTRGAERVGYLGGVPIDYVEINRLDMARLRKFVEKDQFHLVIRKHSLNVFDNPSTHKLVDLIHPGHVVAFGVALDCCVYYVLSELAKHEGIELSLLTDATKGLQTRPDEEVYEELRQRGVEITTFDQIREQLSVGSSQLTVAD
jgi:nicotinamidase/pyrazinamidase